MFFIAQIIFFVMMTTGIWCMEPFPKAPEELEIPLSIKTKYDEEKSKFQKYDLDHPQKFLERLRKDFKKDQDPIGYLEKLRRFASKLLIQALYTQISANENFAALQFTKLQEELEKTFKELVENAYENDLWEELNYRSAKDIKAKKEPQLKAVETNWTLKQKILPDLEEGQSRRPKGSIKIIEIIVRCVVYRDEEKATRMRNLEKLENELEEFKGKLNKYKYKTIEGATKGLENILGKYSKYKKFMKIILKENDNTSICLKWNKDEALLKEEEEKFDGIFALLTNYEKEKVSANKLIEKYRERNEIEMNFRNLKGILDLVNKLLV